MADDIHLKQASSLHRGQRRACHRCRVHHKKCDIRFNGKICSACAAAGAVCKGGGNSELQIRLSNLVHSPGNKRDSDHLPESGAKPRRERTNVSRSHKNDVRASKLPRTRSFLVGTMRPDSSDDGAVEPCSNPLEITSRGTSSSPSTQRPADCYPPYSLADLDLESGLVSFQHREESRSPSIGGEGYGDGAPERGFRLRAISSAENTDQPCLETNASVHWPLSKCEAELVKYFFSFLIPWFDFCCMQPHFRNYIQSTIRLDLGILYAVLAVSSRHLEATRSKYRGSNEYERKCLEILIPALNKNTPQSHDDGVLVSALLLRLLDEMTAPADTMTTIRHTVSAPLFLRIRQQAPWPSELIDAAMTIVLRQEIFVSNMTKRPVELAGEDCGIDDSLGPASDSMWTYRMISHAAKVTNFAYGGQPRTEEAWETLWQYLEEWNTKKPQTFNPLNETTPAIPSPDTIRCIPSTCDELFPKIYYSYDCPLAARQYLEICRILLLATDPRTPALGLGRTSFVKAQEENIRNAVRNTCGIWLCNEDFVPARTLAGLAIAMAGELFNDPAQTERLLDILLDAENHIKWPRLKVSAMLRDFWGLDHENSRSSPVL